jgi:hypothetical protein
MIFFTEITKLSYNLHGSTKPSPELSGTGDHHDK